MSESTPPVDQSDDNPDEPIWTHPNDAIRFELARTLHGHGVEFGPGCHPLNLGPFVKEVRYCDVFDRDGFAREFPEVGELVDGFPERIDFLVDFDKQPFVEMMGPESNDFVVACHVLEHLVDPIAFLEQCYDVLAPGGIVMIGIPDHRHCFDRMRQRTPLSDVVDRYRRREKSLSDQRIVDFINHVEQPPETFGPSSPEFAEKIAWHRRRSIHVNVWVIDDLMEILLFLGRELRRPFELLDGRLPDGEVLLLLRKSAESDVCDRYPLTLNRIFAENQVRLLTEQRAMIQSHLSRQLQYAAEVDEFREHLERQTLKIDHLVVQTREIDARLSKLVGVFRSVPGVRLLESWMRGASPRKKTHAENDEN